MFPPEFLVAVCAAGEARAEKAVCIIQDLAREREKEKTTEYLTLTVPSATAAVRGTAVASYEE